MFHKHVWKVLSEITTESAFEEMKRIGMTANVSGVNIFAKKHICILTCEKCGEIKRYVEDI